MGRSAGSEQPASQQGSDVVLVSMPFGPLFQPSMGLSLLKPAIAQLGVTTKLLYFTFRFAELIGASSYLQISEGQPASYDLVGEWIFSAALFGNASSDAEGYIEEVLGKHLAAHEYMKPVSEAFLRSIIEARAKAESFLGECQHSVTKRAPRIVGFTSVFQQQVASLALARRIKAQNPETFIVFGGANCEGIMGIEVLRQFPFVDAVISGEGDLIFPELVRNVLQGEPLSGLQGVYTRDGTLSVCTKTCYTNAPLVCDLDTLPYPDYDDFFEQLGASRLDSLRAPRIPFETSRGCWWGEQAHCTFCGLNGATMVYRSKSCTRAVEELVYLSTKYPGYDISAVDNIMNMKYFKDFIPELVTRRLGVQLFYEVKANLKKWQVQLLRQAGVTTIQPGIESLSTQVLKLMRKGVRAIENIQLLKWCKELGIRPFWNIIWGFPGEGPEEYASMADLIPLLAHLQPPESAAAIRLDRFSPNFECSEQLGFSDVAAYPAYRYIYPLEPAAVANLAYYFTFKYSSPQDVARYTESVVKSIASWKEVSET
ncbi:MAG: RiPP maturation radical SAM C-methyltransferase, partial [Bacillota bacterium]